MYSELRLELRLGGGWGNYQAVGAGGPFATEASAMQAALNWWLQQQGGGTYCQTPSVRIKTGWWGWRFWYDGSAYEESAIFEITWGEPDFPNAGDCYLVVRGSQAWRSRPINCPTNLEWSHSEQACVRHDIAQIFTNPILACGAPQSPNPLVHNPCNVATGGKYLRETDVEASWVQFSRYYNSSHYAPGAALGQGWTHSLNVRLYLYGGQGPGLLLPEGNFLPFKGQNEAIDGSGWRLSSITSGDIRYEVRGSSKVYSFDSTGKLLRIDNSDGMSIHLEYDALGRLRTATHSSGRSLELVYENTEPAAAAKISSVRSSGAVLASYGYDSSDRLTAVQYSDASRAYHYEDRSFPYHLTGITDETKQRYATYAYNNNGYVTLSEHAGGLNRGTLSYEPDGSTAFTDPNGLVKTFRFSGDGAYRKIVSQSETANMESIAYELEGVDIRRRPLSHTDKRSMVTTYSYLDFNDAVLGSVRRTTTNAAVGTPQARTTQEWRSLDNGWLLKRAVSGRRLTNTTHVDRCYQRSSGMQPPLSSALGLRRIANRSTSMLAPVRYTA